jgi:hypothetical protein
MAKTLLVEDLIRAGERFVLALDAKGLPPTVAFWMEKDDSPNWVLVLAAPALDALGPWGSYSKLLEVFKPDAPAYAPLEFADVVVLPTSHPVVTGMRNLHHTSRQALSRTWFSGNVLNGFLLPDAMVYRAA